MCGWTCRGAKLASRLANWCPERVLAYAFLDIPYWKPFTGTFEDVLAEQKAKVGYELFGYWYWFSEDDIDAVLQANVRPPSAAHTIRPTSFADVFICCAYVCVT